MAEMMEFEVFSSASNAVVARHPGRNYPGVLIQGDTLNGILADVTELIEELDRGDLGETREAASALQERFVDLLTHYEKVLDADGRSLPYPSRVSG